MAEAALAVARKRRGTQFNPDLIDCFCLRHTEILDGHIYAKLGVKTRTEAALFAMRHGLTGMADEART